MVGFRVKSFGLFDRPQKSSFEQMGLTNRKTLTTFAAASKILQLSESAVRKGLCGTHVLSRVPVPNSKRTNLILEEVNQLKDKWIDDAIAANPSLKTEKNGRKFRLVA